MGVKSRLPGLASVYGFLLLAVLFCIFLWGTR